jgi:hypothetical protein
MDHRRLLFLGAAFVLAAAGAIAGLWLGYSAWRRGSQSDGMLAALLLIGSPVLACGAFLSRWGPEPRMEESLRAIRLGRGCLCVMGSGIAVLGISQWWGMISAGRFLAFFAGAWAVIAAVGLPWLARRETRAYEEGR